MPALKQLIQYLEKLRIETENDNIIGCFAECQSSSGCLGSTKTLCTSI